MVTPAIYNGFTFDGVDSKQYGVFITDVKVFGAPVRDVEAVSIPGRNGDLLIDHGRYENIDVVYSAVIHDLENFTTIMANFRSALASKIGYKRLSDDINIGEYRLATFKDGLDVSTLNKKTGQFDITFNCKPQRYLLTGESPQLLVQNMTPKNPQTESGSIVSIEGTGTEVVTSIVAQIEPVQSGSGDPSPTNVRAITGWTDAGINISPYEQTEKHTITGKNLYNAPNDQMSVLVPCHIDGNVRVVISETSASISGFRYYDANKQQIDYWTLSSTASDRRRYRAFTTMRACEYVEFYGAQGTDLMVETGVTVPSPYEPYGTHTNVPLGQTVYGGTVDVVTGTLTVTHASVNIGSLTWSYNNNANGKYFSTAITGKKVGSFNLISSAFKTGSNAYISNLANGGIIGNSSNTNVYAKDERYTTAQAFVTEHANHTIVYELATPQTYNLTAQEVELFTGDNNVWADTGDITITWGDDPYKVVNPTLFASKPLLKVTGRGTLSVGDVTMTITGTASQVLYIDCDIMEVYSITHGQMQPQNSLVTISGNEYPTLQPGATQITLGSGITQVVITPRWWRI